MTSSNPIISQLYRRANADPRPIVLRIGDDEVEPLARYVQMMTQHEVTVQYLVDMIRAGRMAFFGIPVWVRA